MKLIEEVFDYCWRRGMLDECQVLRLLEMGLIDDWDFGDDYDDYDDYDDCDDYWDFADSEEENEKLRVERRGDARLAARRKGGGGKPKRKKTTAPELDALLAPLLDAMFAGDALSRCVEKLGARAGIKETSNVRDTASLIARLPESELLTALTQALDATGRDRLSLNDVYAAILAWPDLTFMKELGGPAVDACRTLLREDYSSGVASRDAWLLGESDAVRDLYWYQRFKLGLIAALRTVYETDKATFKRWSTDGGRLPFPGWETTKKAVDATCWGVWSFEKQEPREVTFAELETVIKPLAFSPKILALRLALTDLLARDFSHLIVVDGDAKQFVPLLNELTDAQPPVFPAVTYLRLSDAVDDALLRRLSKALPNLQTLDLLSFGNVTDAGFSSLSSCANLQTLILSRLFNVTDAGFSSLSSCANLQTLALYSLGNVTDAGLSSLSSCANLQTLILESLYNVTDVGVSSLLRCANLRRLEIRSCAQINGGLPLVITTDENGNRAFVGVLGTDVALQAFAPWFTGDSLRLGGEKITDAALSSLSSYANLQTLEIWRCGAVSDSALTKISGVKGLRSLSLNWCGGFTSAGIAALGAASNLRSLEFWMCDGTSSADVDALRKRLPTCEIRFTPKD